MRACGCYDTQGQRLPSNNSNKKFNERRRAAHSISHDFLCCLLNWDRVHRENRGKWCGARVFRPQIRIENYETHIGPLCSPIGTSACPIGQPNSLTIGGNSPTSASNGDDCPKIPIFMTKPLARLSANNLRCPGVNKSKSVDLCLFSLLFFLSNRFSVRHGD